jgi:HSP20 family protein
MTLVKFNPTRDLLNVEREFNIIYNSLGSRFGLTHKGDIDEKYDNSVWMPLTDISEDNENFYLRADLPGIKKEDVKISYTDGTISISSERFQEKETKEKKFHRIERSYGKYYRSFNVPKEIKEDKIKAEFKDGQLTITIPKADEVKLKEIDIKVS